MEAQISFYQNKLSYELDPSDLFDLLNNGENIIPVDTRRVSGFDGEHIPNAINFPHLEMNEESTRHLDRNALYVTYCDGIGCNASTKGALRMAKLGFKVKELIGGIEWWKFDGYETKGTNANQAGMQVRCAC